ncbi:GtrA family protein [Paraburkholderia dipogonis]|jgi:putative flippase GtrA|uniref:GtrA family protein n=1 Tax=Paraburkholderia dipogonis TaxID=1211383 RepID=UPI0038BA5021
MITRQFVRYIVAGGLGTLAHLAVLAACVELLGWRPVGGAVAGFCAALLISYGLNYQWAFQSRRSRVAGFWRYVVVSLGGLCLNTGMVFALVNYAHCNYFSAQLYVIAIVPVCNFLINRYWTFDAARQTGDEPSA